MAFHTVHIYTFAMILEPASEPFLLDSPMALLITQRKQRYLQYDRDASTAVLPVAYTCPGYTSQGVPLYAFWCFHVIIMF
jgi:hypothetical protein